MRASNVDSGFELFTHPESATMVRIKDDANGVQSIVAADPGAGHISGYIFLNNTLIPLFDLQVGGFATFDLLDGGKMGVCQQGQWRVYNLNGQENWRTEDYGCDHNSCMSVDAAGELRRGWEWRSGLSGALSALRRATTIVLEGV